MIDWISIAILGTVALGLVNIFDSHFVSRRMPSLRAYLLLVSSVMLTFGLLTLYLFPLPDGVSPWPLAVAIISGILRTAAVAILLYVLKTEEVSRAVPVFYTYPVLVAIMAIPLLGETLSYLHWLAVIAVVTGAVVISARRVPGGPTTVMGKPFLFLMGSGLIMAFADISSKYALGYVSFWNMYWISALSMSGIFLIFSLRRRTLEELSSMSRQKSTIGLVAFNESLAVAGIILIFRAMESGPVSLVSTITGSRPIFVFILALILSRVRPGFLLEGQPGRGVLALRLIATAMIVGGIAIIYTA